MADRAIATEYGVIVQGAVERLRSASGRGREVRSDVDAHVFTLVSTSSKGSFEPFTVIPVLREVEPNGLTQT